MWAAKGGLQFSAYPWGGFIRNSNGCLLCNFHIVGDENIKYDAMSKTLKIDTSSRGMPVDYYSPSKIPCITSHVLSYNPNGYGLYNISGNVAELTASPGIAKGGS